MINLPPHPQTTGAGGRPPPGLGSVAMTRPRSTRTRPARVSAATMASPPGCSRRVARLTPSRVRNPRARVSRRICSGVRVSASATGASPAFKDEQYFSTDEKFHQRRPAMERMRPRAQPQVGGPGPVLQVVAAAIVAQASSLWSLPGEIGHFVVEIASRREEIGGEEEKFPLGLFVRQGEFAPGRLPGHRRPQGGGLAGLMVN